MRVFTHYEVASPLRHINPTIKLAVSLVVMLIATVVFDMVVLSLILGFGLLLAAIGGRCGIGTIARGLIPFALFGSGYIFMNALLPRETGTVLVSLGPVAVSAPGLLNGLRFALRALGFGAWSLVFVATTDPIDLVRSLNQNLRLPGRFTYSALAAYRYLPTLESEIALIRQAHRLRGVGEGRNPGAAVQRAYRFTIPLLAGGLRRAGRVADAMEVRGLGNAHRTHFRRVLIQRRDIMYAVVVIGMVIATVFGVGGDGPGALWTGRLW